MLNVKNQKSNRLGLGRMLKHHAKTVCIVTTSLMIGAGAQAEVTLKSHDGSVSLEGDLIAFGDDVYVLRTNDMGTLRIPAANVFCEGPDCPVIEEYSPNFGIYGSRTVGTTLIPNLLRGYAASVDATYELITTDDAAERIIRLTNADGTLRAEIDLQSRGSGSAFPALADGSAAIGVADRRMKDSDLEKIAAAGVPELRDTGNETVLGLDGIAVITHPNNPVRDLSSLDVARIWAGEITNWRELGGGDMPIKVKSFGEGSGDRAVLLDGLVRPNGRDETVEVTRFSAYQDMIDSVMAEPGAVGYVGRWLARTNDVNLVSIREECGLLSPPTDFRMKIEGYALSRRLYAYTNPGAMHPEAQAFLDWTLTTEAQAYIKESHFIDRELERMRLEDMGMMLIHTAASEPDFDGRQYSNMMRDLRGADRLSISFRFNNGSAILDTESVRNIQELGTRLQQGQFEGMEVLLVGFADSVGTSARNTVLAQNRAESVRSILLETLPAGMVAEKGFTPLSYGELLPLSCNETDEGRERNRRVEVWLRPANIQTASR